MSLEFRLRKIDETRNYFLEKIKHIYLVSKKYKLLNYIEHLVILVSAITDCFSISTFTSLVGISMGIVSSTVGLKICVIT